MLVNLVTGWVTEKDHLWVISGRKSKPYRIRGGINFGPVKFFKEPVSRVWYACEINFGPLLVFDATMGSKMDQILFFDAFKVDQSWFWTRDKVMTHWFI